MHTVMRPHAHTHTHERLPQKRTGLALIAYAHLDALRRTETNMAKHVQAPTQAF